MVRVFDPRFDSELIEYTAEISGAASELYTVDVYKIGGGTVGKNYDGRWGVRVRNASGAVLLMATDLQTGIPCSHDQIPAIVLDFVAKINDYRHEFSEDIDDMSMCTCGVSAVEHWRVDPVGR